jgi:nucleoside-diphosphate-sugar epimerase
MRVLVTGATGFIGRFLCRALAERQHVVRAALRQVQPAPAGVAEQVVVGDIGRATRWSEALQGVDAVIHAAARVHVAGEAADDAGRYLESNLLATQCLARAAADMGVRRFVFLSTIKVNGEQTASRPYTAHDEPRPHGAYARSKWLAEQSLTEMGAGSGMHTAIVRPPLVYGPGVRANFLRLLRSVDAQRLLPLGAVANLRSLVSVWNLCDLLTSLAMNPSADGCWLVSDGEDVSSPELVRRMARAMSRQARLLPVPPALLRLCGALVGRRDDVMRLCGSLTVDIAETRQRLHWVPPVSLDEGLARTVAWYLSQARCDAP